MREISRRTLLAGAALSPLASDYRIIDPHVHVWKHDPEYPFSPGARVPARDATPEMLLKLMKTNGVSQTVIIQVIHYRYDNSYLAGVLKRYPGLFQGVARVDPLDAGAPDQLSRLTEEGFRGVRLSPPGDTSGDWFHGPLMPPLWKRCLDLIGADDGAGADRADAGSGAAAGKISGADGGDRPHGGLPGGPAGRAGEADRAAAVSEGVREDLAYLVAFEAGVSVAGRAGVGEAALLRVWAAAADVGHGLADCGGLVDVCAGARSGAG